MGDTIGVLAAACGISAIVVIAVATVLRRPPADPGPAPDPAPGLKPIAEPEPRLIPMGYRWCPEELRTRAVILHADGSATCTDPDCGAHIPPAGER